MKHDIQYLVIDLFCGGGGTTTGFEKAMVGSKKICKVIAAVNHDPLAIQTHAANHSDVLHVTEDIRNLSNIPVLISHIDKCKVKYPNAKLILWGSLECTNFSNAKNGPRDRDSRTLAWDFLNYVEALQPHIVQIENVREFMAWGDLDYSGRPVSRDKGKEYIKWVKAVSKLGYDFDWKLLNSADYGEPQTRIRYFAIFSRPGIENKWPTQTHAKNVDGMFSDLKQWRPVKDVLNLSDVGQCIFDRKKPLCERTMKRIYAGLLKFVGDGFVMKNNSGHESSKCVSLNKPTGTLSAKCHQSLVVPEFAFLQKYYGTGSNVSAPSSPCSTLTTKDRVSAVWIDRQFGTGRPRSANAPAGAILPNDKNKVVTAHFILNPQYNNNGSSINEPCGTVIARQDKTPLGVCTAEFILSGQYDNGPMSMNEPSKTITASRHRPSIIHLESGQCDQGKESGYAAKIREFMSNHGISKIYMRGLKIPELLRIQGFPSNYVLKGTQSDQKKFIGNAVVPAIPKAWIEAIFIENNQL